MSRPDTVRGRWGKREHGAGVSLNLLPHARPPGTCVQFKLVAEKPHRVYSQVCALLCEEGTIGSTMKLRAAHARSTSGTGVCCLACAKEMEQPFWFLVDSVQKFAARFAPTHTKQHQDALVAPRCHVRFLLRAVFVANDRPQTADGQTRLNSAVWPWGCKYIIAHTSYVHT